MFKKVTWAPPLERRIIKECEDFFFLKALFNNDSLSSLQNLISVSKPEASGLRLGSVLAGEKKKKWASLSKLSFSNAFAQFYVRSSCSFKYIYLEGRVKWES